MRTQLTIYEPICENLDEERTFENQDITLKVSIHAKGKLWFKHCVIRTEDEVAISGCIFEDCSFIKCATLESCIFLHCRMITASDGGILHCKFDQVNKVYSYGDISHCQFANISCDQDTVITLEDGTISYCTFDGVDLRNGAYLIEATGDVWIEYSDFKNCHTDRMDGELIHCEEVSGRIVKKRKEFDIVDNSTCTGIE